MNKILILSIFLSSCGMFGDIVEAPKDPVEVEKTVYVDRKINPPCTCTEDANAWQSFCNDTHLDAAFRDKCINVACEQFATCQRENSDCEAADCPVTRL